MCELESQSHLYEPTLYRVANASWHRNYADAVECGPTRLTLDPAAVLSILSFNYCCGDRTLLNEVKRRPWLSKLDEDGDPTLQEIPSHGTTWQSISEIAANLRRLLFHEAIRACRDRSQVYVLLSGGLDSRVIAGIIAELVREGRLSCQPVAVTWGLRDSRDVVYSRMVAEVTGFESVHIELSPDSIRQNIETVATELGCLVPPHHLHGMLWFTKASKDALVLAGSYGDGIGRGEYSGRHILQQRYLSPVNSFGLLKQEIAGFAYSELMKDLQALHNRVLGRPEYVQCEHEQQCHYMRGMIAHAMSIINKYCRVYQMFTDPSVYAYMWSLHPALRTDDVYAALLQKLDERLLRIPWARTNRALSGATACTQSNLRPDFHEYVKWIRGPLYHELYRYVDPEWFNAVGIFDAEKIQVLRRDVRYCRHAVFNLYDSWLWLASFRRFVEYLGQLGRSVEVDKMDATTSTQTVCRMSHGPSRLVRLILGRSLVLNAALKWMRGITRRGRRERLMRKSRRRYPTKCETQSTTPPEMLNCM
jgi:hypothetical protein